MTLRSLTIKWWEPYSRTRIMIPLQNRNLRCQVQEIRSLLARCTSAFRRKIKIRLARSDHPHNNNKFKRAKSRTLPHFLTWISVTLTCPTCHEVTMKCSAKCWHYRLHARARSSVSGRISLAIARIRRRRAASVKVTQPWVAWSTLISTLSSMRGSK